MIPALRSRSFHATMPAISWPAYVVSLCLAAVSAIGAALTFFVPGVLQGTRVMNGSARGTALIVFTVAVPMLLVSLFLASRGAARAVVTWLGAATYLLYNAVLFLIATPFNSLFLLYVAMFALSFWSVVLVLHEIDVPVFARRFAPTFPARALGAFLGIVAVLNALLWLKGVIPALFAPLPPSFLEGTGLTTMPTYVQDLSFWLPLTIVVAVWLWQRHAWGMVLGGALIVYGFIESVGVATDQAFGHAADPNSSVVAVAAIPGFAIMAVIELLVAYFYFRSMIREPLE